MQPIRYSLIIPHHCDALRLERLLRTIPMGRRDIETIVIDDCSPDQASVDTLKSRWPTVRWLSTYKNSGAGAARNVGLLHAKGEYLAFADSDDKFLPGAFDIFDRYVNSGLELIYFFAQAEQEVDGTPSIRSNWMNQLCTNYLEAPSDDTLMRLKLKHVVPCAKLYLHEFIRRIDSRFEEVRFSNDVAFNVLSAVQAKYVLAVPMPVYLCFRRHNSLTANSTREAFLIRVEVQVRLADKLKGLGLGLDYLPPKSALLVASAFGYGFSTTCTTWKLIRHSQLRPMTLRELVDLSLWFEFLKKIYTEGKEKRKACRLSSPD